MSNRATIIAPSPLRFLRAYGGYENPPHLSASLRNVSCREKYPDSQVPTGPIIPEHTQKEMDPILDHTDYSFAVFELRAIVGSTPYTLYEPINRRNHFDVSREILLFPAPSREMKWIDYDVRSTPQLTDKQLSN
ncbi:hypothetical protein PHYBLDRAFT_62435 [Phycomyces blakesleeanus NRRL 1555(-)]|uniref:Uncharacterized protein n=1 Tax=Phycomyces blakesleeanus (strain ATCC 8743b / DSM 1359 / FGSC 10004 / NBRC 33097 / NRRL 1555) TaxID=763407 RepID=A0A167PZA8_PHYB8|nr:hypothetical protein PHYBLDRAFT_62435 [Phycomyces blakesleeanus NRRL 1555(-)]OAD78806.1 hypothetical protein PHYBLDRAFT_62435 [Phycomyces blakesleeanus NRRL 1555(-)]|eukprot:XP_018296846.1 hypothetical protein PHYBLDRAFT_62435 [Phycomyces blakesleeanus NRRL 1555(-)]